MQMRPRDLAPLRRDLIRLGKSDMFSNLTSVQAWASGEVDETQRSLARSMQAACTLQDAELFYVDEKMCDLVAAAAKTLPAFQLEQHDAPSLDGFAWLTKSVLDHDPEGTRLPVHAISWQMVHGVGGHATFQISIYVERDLREPAFAGTKGHLKRLGFPEVFPLGAWRMPLDEQGQPMKIFREMEWREDVTSGTVGERSLATLKTLWLLMRQPMTQQTEARPDRAERRRAVREGHELPAVRVIQLRRPPGGGGSGQGGGTEWHHQWIVRGHWRDQPHGPGKKLRRPVWISPYVKGPADAPLIGGEKVYTVKGSSDD